MFKMVQQIQPQAQTSPVVQQTPTTQTIGVQPVPPVKKKKKWWLWLIIGIVLGAGITWMILTFLK